MHRRVLLLSLLIPLLANAQPDRLVPSSPVDAVALYVIPTDGIPEQFAAGVARSLTQEAGVWVKASLLMPSGVADPIPGTQQYAVEDYLAFGTTLAKRLQDAGPRTYFIVVTDRDINSRERNFRFQYSAHSPMARTSVLSLARLGASKDGKPASAELIGLRLQKMLMRIVGEMKLGWTRTTDPTDLMYAPIMSIDDIDRMSLTHTMKVRGVAK
ncbi:MULTISPECIES: zinc metalloprotease [unclassified Roseateles]|uniref:hypothetical protein n=1 Tax=Pelomonas sp. Root1237 TaxID=1736434 RepID=UPI000701317F|nr:hypothetical protein [Pelomonas sp. Root1237]KQV95668.1 hypothetical protein ASC91_25560 [Pelomonas sp. Root1237]